MRARITFSKSGSLRYIGHLDLLTIWERASRRAGLPLAYTQGFHPQPKINLASALPLGFSSRCEVVDIHLNEDVNIANLPAHLQAAMPSGISILNVESVDESEPALQTQVIAAEYEVTLTESVDPSKLMRRIEELLANTSLPRQRRGKAYDLRPLIEELSLTPAPLRLPPNSLNLGGEKERGREGQGVRVYMRLSAREGATGRPDEVMDALGFAIEDTRIERTRLLFRE